MTTILTRFFKYLGYLIISLAVVPLVLLLIYDAIWFQPNQIHLKNTLETLSSECAHPTPELVSIIKVAYGGYLIIPSTVARYSIFESYPETEDLPIGWHADHFIWSLLTDIHYSELEEISALCTVLWNGEGEDRGFNNFSLRIYDKPLSELRLEELALVVANSFSPSYFFKRPEVTKRKAKRLLENMSEDI